MDAAATLVWLAPDPPSAEQSRAVASWSRMHGVRLALPTKGAVKALHPDPRVAEDVEALLQGARDAVGERDGERADRSLSAAEAALRAHPELPQAAWLMAEVERTRATRWRRVPPLDLEAAEAAWQRADALDGGRVAGVGERASAAHPPAATVMLHVSPDDAQLWFDGRPIAAGAIATLAGMHDVVATWGDVPVWAAWIETPAGTSSVDISAPAAPACSTDDVAHARATGDVLDAARVRCAAWVAVVPGSEPTGIRIATCEQHRCGAFFDWHSPLPWTWSPPAEPIHRSGWPAWATWSIAGGGALVAAAAVLVASGVLQPASTETRFVGGGVQTH